MANDCKKINTNVYFEARKKAAICNDALNSRMNAADMLGLSESTLSDYELGLTKIIPPDNVVRMAHLYNAYHLMPRYCVEECPIHGFLPMATEERDMRGIVLRIIQRFNRSEIEEMKEELVNIIEDGDVSEEESDRLREIMLRLESIVEVVSEMKISCEKLLHEGGD